MFVPKVIPPFDTAPRRTPSPAEIVEYAAVMGYEELKKYLNSLNATPITYEAELYDCCDRRGL